MLGKKNGPKLKVLGQTPTEWINDHRSFKMWDRTWSPSIIAEAKALNTFMNSFESNNPIRMADWHHVGDIFGVNSAPSDNHWKIINNGMAILKSR